MSTGYWQRNWILYINMLSRTHTRTHHTFWQRLRDRATLHTTGNQWSVNARLKSHSVCSTNNWTIARRNSTTGALLASKFVAWHARNPRVTSASTFSYLKKINNFHYHLRAHGLRKGDKHPRPMLQPEHGATLPYGVYILSTDTIKQKSLSTRRRL